MDLSGLIFVALAIAWAAYLIPKALRHHDDVVRGRSVDRFSQSMRVLARREPVSARMARLVVTPARPRTAVVTTKPSAVAASPDEPYAARRLATPRATQRRRRVLALLLLALVARRSPSAPPAPGLALRRDPRRPAGRLAGGLPADGQAGARLAARPPSRSRRPRPVEGERVGPAGSIAPVADRTASPADGLWDPVPVTLPTYVSKPPARRSVRTIDLDSTGVWTSGRTEADSALAREAEAADRVRRRASRKAEAGRRGRRLLTLAAEASSGRFGAARARC